MSATTRAGVYADALVRLPFSPHPSVAGRVIRTPHYGVVDLCDDAEFIAGRTDHSFAVVIHRRDEGERFPKGIWEPLAPHVRPGFEEHYDDGRFVAAFLDIVEFPARTQYQVATSWHDWLDRYDTCR